MRYIGAKSNYQVERLKKMFSEKEQECEQLRSENDKLQKDIIAKDKYLETIQQLFKTKEKQFRDGLLEVKKLRDKYEEALQFLRNTKKQYKTQMSNLEKSAKR